LSHPRCLYHRTSHHPPRATHFPTRRSSDLFDARKAVKEQVESLGARFVEVPSDEDAQTAGGYAKETSAAYQERQRALIAERLARSEEHTSELQSHLNLVCRLLLEKKKNPHP